MLHNRVILLKCIYVCLSFVLNFVYLPQTQGEYECEYDLHCGGILSMPWFAVFLYPMKPKIYPELQYDVMYCCRKKINTVFDCFPITSSLEVVFLLY